MMEDVPTFHFHHQWRLPAAPERVYEALADVERYAVWWPQVRSAERLDEHSGRTDIRSFLPYTLHLVLRREVEDASTGHLRVGVSGDLEGWCEWRVRAPDRAPDGAPDRAPDRAPDGAPDRAPDRGAATIAEFDQEAVLTPALLARTAQVTGPLLRANHSWMMRSGRAGLAAYLSERPWSASP